MLATRWTVLAQNAGEAWTALSSMRGMRAPGRLYAVDPAQLRAEADIMDPSEVLGRYAIVSDPAGLVDAYRPLVTEMAADIVSIQVASVDPMTTIRLIGQEVLPQLRSLSSARTFAGEG